VILLRASGLLASGGGAGGGETLAPTFGLGTTIPSAANAASHTFNGHSSATGDLLFRLFARNNGSGLSGLAMTWGGAAVTHRASALVQGGGRAVVWIGTIKGGLTGARTAALTASGGQLGNCLLRVSDLSGWAGSVGAAVAQVTNTSRSSYSVSATMQGSSRLLGGLGGAVHGGCDPLSASGWSKSAEADTGAAADTDCAAAFFSRSGGAAGASVSLNAASATSTDDWGCGFVELL
jgi:hypothetical protein